MRQNGIPPVFRQSWPTNTDLNYSDLKDNFLWSPWGVFVSEYIHCYTDDYRFESVWRKPELSLKRVLDLKIVIAPDFSVYQDAPANVNRWQLHRSLAVFSYWQNMGVRVIPSISWISPEQIRQDLDLYPDFSIIAVRCPTREYLDTWLSGAEIIRDQVKPKTVLHFGTALGSDIWTDSQVYQFNLRPNIPRTK